jgi:predicted component of type VI protein secretion system
MEAVAAVGLASNIFQVIDVTKNIATTIKDIRKSTSGFSTETNRFRSLAQLVRKDISSLLASRSNVDDDLQQCIGRLRSQLDKFIIELDSLRLVEPKSLYQSSKIATKIWWRRERITDYVTTIQQISN